ncbi:MAG: hypothetical protein Q9164_007508, partial [Protoblastenia rupestris]
KYFNGIVQAKVGPVKTTFTFHKGMLTSISPYFHAAFEGAFMESSDRTLYLPQEDPKMFARFQLWVYTKSILDEGESATDLDARVLTQLYVFGELCQASALQNAVIDAYIDKSDVESTIYNNELRLIYDSTPPDAPIRRLFVDWAVHEGSFNPGAWFKDENFELFPQRYLIDLIEAQYAMRIKKKARIQDFKSVRSDYYSKGPS